jgi:hypothetical protein
MQLVLQAPGELLHNSSKQNHKAPKLTSNAKNEATNAKLESAKHLAT